MLNPDRSQWPHLDLDVNQQRFSIYSWFQNHGDRATHVNIKDIQYFLGYAEELNRYGSSDDTRGYIYAVANDGDKTCILELEAIEQVVKEHTQAFGFICDKPAFLQDQNGNLLSLYNPNSPNS
jgi:hypothetical protein